MLQALQGDNQLWKPVLKNVYYADEAKTEAAKRLSQYLQRYAVRCWQQQTEYNLICIVKSSSLGILGEHHVLEGAVLV
jgi:hypothetical protein